jgi:hypothetical protein
MTGKSKSMVTVLFEDVNKSFTGGSVIYLASSVSEALELFSKDFPTGSVKSVKVKKNG